MNKADHKKTQAFRSLGTWLLVLLFSSALALASPGSGSLRAGAARIEITPTADQALPMAGYGKRVEPHQAVHDKLYVRALVVDDGERQAAVISCEILFVTEEIWKNASQRLARETGLPAEAVLIAATHTHGAPSSLEVKPEFAERTAAWTRRVENAIVDAVREAKAALQPARFGVAKGQAYVNTNRRARMANGEWGLGINPEGPSDKTLAVVRFDTLAGAPIAILMNYAVHGVVLGPKNFQITGDLPGAAAGYVEQHFEDKVVALWTSGASGDQNPIYATQEDFGRLGALARILGEEAVRLASSTRTNRVGRVSSAQKVVTCPARGRESGSNLPGAPVRFAEGDPVPIRVSVVKIGHLALAGVSGEVLTGIGERLKSESPFSDTLMVTHCNGSVGYLPDDHAYDQRSYEIQVTPVKRGCAENATVTALLEMIDRN